MGSAGGAADNAQHPAWSDSDCGRKPTTFRPCTSPRTSAWCCAVRYGRHVVVCSCSALKPDNLSWHEWHRQSRCVPR
eukprot:9354716-Prorocentrum_lima.AAC.1